MPLVPLVEVHASFLKETMVKRERTGRSTVREGEGKGGKEKYEKVLRVTVINNEKEKDQVKMVEQV